MRNACRVSKRYPRLSRFYGDNNSGMGQLYVLSFGMFAPNRGLTLESNVLGEASLAGALAFFPALIGAVTLFYAVISMLRAEPSD